MNNETKNILRTKSAWNSQGEKLSELVGVLRRTFA